MASQNKKVDGLEASDSQNTSIVKVIVLKRVERLAKNPKSVTRRDEKMADRKVQVIAASCLELSDKFLDHVGGSFHDSPTLS